MVYLKNKNLKLNSCCIGRWKPENVSYNLGVCRRFNIKKHPDFILKRSIIKKMPLPWFFFSFSWLSYYVHLTSPEGGRIEIKIFD